MRIVHKEHVRWTHPSIHALAGQRDPVAVITERARNVVERATQDGWSGPPFDPFQLAERLGITVTPREDLLDARILAEAAGRFHIEYNPLRPKARVRYSLAHEIAHTLFPDCAKETRHRLKASTLRGDDWQLELLCNLGAAEILMPRGSFAELRRTDLSRHD